MAVLGGFGLGIAGMIYQTVLRNPLASPDIIGVSSGASAGAAVALLFLSGTMISVTACAFLGSISAVVLVLGLSAVVPRKNNGTMVLAGLAVHSLAQTLLMILKLSADPERELAAIEYWIMGSLNGITIQKIPFTFFTTSICVTALFLLYRQVLLLSMEEEEARSLGVFVKMMRICILFFATLIVAAIVSVTGIISFVGLLAPHTAKLLTKNSRVSTLWLSGILGSVLLCLADILARSVSVNELPVSIFTSILGAPFLIFLMMRKGEIYG
jgi:iron complex transport system permease protein